MKLSDFDFSLPNNLIAQKPLPHRSSSRMMVLHRKERIIEHKKFYHIPQYLKKGDLLVFNNTRVMPARLKGVKEGSGGKVEILLVSEKKKGVWEALVKPGRRIKPGHRLIFGNGKLIGEVIGWTSEGTRIIDFKKENLIDYLKEIGEIPLPPYIKTSLEDEERYQTIFAKDYGSSAAPTAGLHFDEDIMNDLKKIGVEWVYVTLHIGPGTFRPVKTEDITKHKMHSEYFKISQETIEKIISVRRAGGRIIPVGTTSVRTLESVFDENLNVLRQEGWTDIFIYPGYSFKCADALITNFHLPKSTLLMLVSAFAGLDFIKRAYQEAIEKKYRFFSFGDCMLIL